MTQPEPYTYTDPSGDRMTIGRHPTEDGPVVAFEQDDTIYVLVADVEQVVTAIRAAAGTQPAADGDRRDRYAAAISGKTGWHGGKDQQHLIAAVMAVADAELRAQAFAHARQLGDLAREKSGLRAELEQARTVAGQPDRAAVLTERADFFEGVLRNAADPGSDPRYWSAINDVVMGLRRMADEAQQAEPPSPAKQRLQAAVDKVNASLPGHLLRTVRAVTQELNAIETEWHGAHRADAEDVHAVLARIRAALSSERVYEPQQDGHRLPDTTETSR